jgi:hypothetical protein
LSEAANIQFLLTDETGHQISESSYLAGFGTQIFSLNPGNLAAGMYFWSAAITYNAGNKSEMQYGKLMHF